MRTVRLVDGGYSRRPDRVAVLGPNAAEQLGVTRIDGLRSISIGDDVFLVIGMLDSVQRKHDLLSSVIIPEGTARRLYHMSAPESVVAETEVGAASMLSRQLPLALRPDAPSGLKVASPEEPQRIRSGIESDLNILFLMLGGVSLLVGAIGIANVTLVSVMEHNGIAVYVQTLLLSRLSFHVVTGLQTELFRHLIRADMAFFHENAPAK